MELDDKGWAYIRQHMLEEPAAYPWLCQSASETLGYEFNYNGLLLEIYEEDEDPASQVSFYLPTEYLEEHGPGRVRGAGAGAGGGAALQLRPRGALLPLPGHHPRRHPPHP